MILGQDVAAVSYSDLLSILLLNGYTAIESGNYIDVIPISSIRVEALPVATAKDNFPDAQFVTTVVAVKSVPAPQLVPILRPLIPTYGHLAAMPCINSLLILVDNFANVKRLEKLVAALDVGKQPFHGAAALRGREAAHVYGERKQAPTRSSLGVARRRRYSMGSMPGSNAMCTACEKLSRFQSCKSSHCAAIISLSSMVTPSTL